MNKMRLEIRSTVSVFLENVNIGTREIPQMNPSLCSGHFVDLYKRLYGVGTRDELLRRSFELQLQSNLGIKDFLRAMIGAAVTEWVLNGSDGLSSADLEHKPDFQSMYRYTVANCEFFHILNVLSVDETSGLTQM